MFEYLPQWWHWVAFGLCLSMLELLMPMFFVLWFGAGAVVLGILLFIVPSLSLTTQLVLWTCFSSGLAVLWFRFFRNHAAPAIGSATAHIAGESGVLIETLLPDARGHVRFQKPILGAEVWECYADEEIAAGERVRVAAVQGNFMKVEKV